MPARYYFLIVGVIGAALFLGQATFMSYVQAVSTVVKAGSDAVRDGTKVTVHYHITPLDDPTMIYDATEEFVQGQHLIPQGIEQQAAGMQPGETKTFSLSAEEGFGPYDPTMIQTIPTADVTVDAREGDSVEDEAGRTARIMSISPETTVLNLNHPLAGLPILVTLKIMTIKAPDNVDESTVGNVDHLDVVIVPPRNGYGV